MTDIAAQVQGTYGPTIHQVWQVSMLVKMVSSLIILLVIMMFVRMIIADQRHMISIKKAMGFRFTYNLWSVAINMLFAGFAAILAVYLGSSGITSIKAVECCRGGE